MSDNIPVTPSSDGAAKTVRSEDIGGFMYQAIRLWLGGAGVAVRADSNHGAAGDGTLRVTLADDDPLIQRWDAGGAVCTAQITRPANTTTYTAEDVLADAAAVTGGSIFANAARTGGEGGQITDILIISSNDPTTKLQAELWIFDSAVTEIADNAAFSLSDANAIKLVGIIPFTLASGGAASSFSYAHVQNLNIGYEAVGSADLRFLVRVKNAYVPASGEVLTMRLKAVRSS